jgi:ABC-type branched-subunit amino acid transport system ATPase component
LHWHPTARPETKLQVAWQTLFKSLSDLLASRAYRIHANPVKCCLCHLPAGKSSILQAILSKMIVQEGRLNVGGTIAYVPQSPWVQNLSLRDNILFGMPYDEEKYKAVIHACALELDLKILPNGMDSVTGCS